MFQLKLSDDGLEIIEDIFYWKTKEDIPSEIITWIIDLSDRLIIYQYEEEKCYCAKCLNQLDNSFYCSHCETKHPHSFEELSKYETEELYSVKELVLTDEIQDDYFHYFSFYQYYYTFDVIQNHVFLYLLKEQIYYDNPSVLCAQKHSEITIEKAYFITKEGIKNLKKQQFYSFDECEYSIELRFFDDEVTDEEYKKYTKLETLLNDTKGAYLYQGNLEKLKTTIYQYSHLFEHSDYLNQQSDSISLAQLTFFPIYCESFEYLLNYKLYHLAFHSANYFKKKGSFREMFGVDKKFLPFMQKLDINYSLLDALGLYPKEDLEILKFIEQNPYITRILKEDFHLDLAKVKQYFDKNHYTVDDLDEYRDYLDMAKKLELDLTNNTILFPKNLYQEHNHLYRQLELKKDPELENKIKNIANLAMVNAYEDDVYKIFPASSLEDLLDESNQMNNCVRLYAEKIANLECVIYFLRKKENLSKSFVTIEVRGIEITQARERFNQLPNDEVKKLLKEWEKTIVPLKISPKKKS